MKTKLPSSPISILTDPVGELTDDDVPQIESGGEALFTDNLTSTIPTHKTLPADFRSTTHTVRIDEIDYKIVVGFFDNNTPGEIIINAGKGSDQLNNLLNTTSALISMMLQYGISIEAICNELKNFSFAPSGDTSNPQIPKTKSILDYLSVWLLDKFKTSSATRLQDLK